MSALEKCPECHAPVEPTAATCPHCHQNLRINPLKIITALILLAIVVAFCAPG